MASGGGQASAGAARVLRTQRALATQTEHTDTERVALLGGSLSAGPTSAGGFMVSVVLPLGEIA